MSDCCVDLRKYCEGTECTCEKTDDGIRITLTGKTDERIDELHKLVDKNDCSCC